MDRCDENELLERYAAEESDEAFHRLVTRYVDFVYSAALRKVDNRDLAEEVTQRVFILLARKARRLSKGTLLSGWFFRATRFVSAEVLRTENRRRLRERQAMPPGESDCDSSQWAEVEPLLDTALSHLSELDRNAVLLRYFQGRSLKQVGEALGINEDAAQKRVARSLEKLQKFFLKRGTAMPGAGLGALLSEFAVQSAPAGIASSVVSAVASSAGKLSFSALVLETISLMTAKQTAALLAGVIIAATASSLMLWQTARKLEHENQALRTSNRQLESARAAADGAAGFHSNVAGQRQYDVMEPARPRAPVAAFGGDARREGNDVSSTNGAAPSRFTNPVARMEHGRALARQGNSTEALNEFLWCFDEGAKDPAFAGVRLSFLLADIAALAKELPAAHDALVSRRDAAESAVLQGGTSGSIFLELTSLNAKLGEANRTLELFDQLPPGSADRANLVRAAKSDFLAARRYQDIVEVTDPTAWFFQRMSQILGAASSSAIDPNRSRLPQVQIRTVVNAGADALEALAGAGQSEQARNVAEKVLLISSTPETVEQLISQAERSGNREITEFLRAKAAQP